MATKKKAKKKITKKAKSPVKKASTKKTAKKKAASKKTASKKAVVKKKSKKVAKKQTASNPPVRKKQTRAALQKAAAFGGPPKASPYAKLTQAQINKLHSKLLAEKERLLADIAKHIGEATAEADVLPDEADLANRHAQQAYLLRYADKENKLLRLVQRAISKMGTGDYGICEGTEEPIAFKRLELRPWTRYSVEHKEELERQKSIR